MLTDPAPLGVAGSSVDLGEVVFDAARDGDQRQPGWPMEISLYEDDGTTRAEARLARDGVGMIGHGLARRHPGDREVTQIG